MAAKEESDSTPNLGGTVIFGEFVFGDAKKPPQTDVVVQMLDNLMETLRSEVERIKSEILEQEIDDAAEETKLKRIDAARKAT